jgi:hypothetical protein
MSSKGGDLEGVWGWMFLTLGGCPYVTFRKMITPLSVSRFVSDVIEVTQYSFS